MKFPWTKREPVFLEQERSKRGRETLTQTAERIIQRKMKKDPDGYGLEAAEKLKGMRKDTTNPFTAYKEIKTMLKELQQETGTGEGKGLMVQILQALPAVPAILEQLKQVQSQNMTKVITERPRQQSLPEPEKKIPKQEQPKQEQPTASLSELIGYFDSEPEQVIADLKERYAHHDQQSALWIGLLGNKTYEEVMSILEPLRGNADYGPHVEELMSQGRREWLEKVLALAKQAYADIKNAHNSG